MKAIILKGFGGVDQLLLTELPTPPATSEGTVLVQVKAISINPVDVKTREGKGVAGRLKPFDPIILGWDVSGVVRESNSPLFKEGDEVFGMVNFPGHGKVYAEYVTAPAAHLTLKPASISHPAAAAATLSALTAWQALVNHGRLQPAKRILIHAAAGGVGHFAVQIAKFLGAYVIGTSSKENRTFVLGLGADEHIDYKVRPFEELVRDVDFVLDTIGGENIERSIKITNNGGTIVSIPSGLNEGVKGLAKSKGINLLSFLVESNGKEMGYLARLLEEGTMRSEVSKLFPFEQMAAAHLQVESGKTRGKTIVTV